MSTFDLGNRINIANPAADVDSKYGPYDGADLAAATAAACEAIPRVVRAKGLTVGITVNGGPVAEYQWKDGVTDADLELKSTVYTHPDHHDPGIITETSEKKFVSQGQVDGWDAKTTTQQVLDFIAAAVSQYVTASYVQQAIANLVDSSPDALNTLNELAAALGDDPNFATTITNLIAEKVDKISGKGLSTNDYTTAEKNKLADIAAGANKTTVDASLNASSTNPVQNKVVQVALAGKAASGHAHSETDVNAMLNKLSLGSAAPVDTDYYISQYAGGGTTYTTYYRRPVLALWNYIRSKANSVYALISHTHAEIPVVTVSATQPATAKAGDVWIIP